MSDIVNEELEFEDNADDLNGQFLTFFIGDSIYGVELLNVKEIIQIESITHVPFTPDFIKGIINLRGGVVPVIDVRLKFHLEEKEYDDKTCIIIVEYDGGRVGIIVDGISEVVTLDNADLAEPPKVDNARGSDYLQSVAEVDGKIVLLLDCAKFFQDAPVV